MIVVIVLYPLIHAWASYAPAEAFYTYIAMCASAKQIKFIPAIATKYAKNA